MYFLLFGYKNISNHQLSSAKPDTNAVSNFLVDLIKRLIL